MRGGKRPGAGPPQIEDESERRVPITIRLPRWIVMKIREQDESQSVIIERGVRRVLRLKRKK